MATVLLVRATPEVVEVKNFTPAIQWQTDSSLAEESWWPALVAVLDPGKLTYAEWEGYHSDAVQQRVRNSGRSYEAYVAGVSERARLHECNEIAQLVFIKDEDAEYLAVLERVAKSTEANSGDTYRILFLRKTQSGWINWIAPMDAPFDAELFKLVTVPQSADTP